jgi:hypothetical protein
MAVESSHLVSTGRDAYWQTTRAELQSAQRRGDALSLAGLALIGVLIWYSADSGGKSVLWVASITVTAMAVVALPQLFVARGKRRIASARGMNCRHCGYVPHHTEISEVIATHECRRCAKPLDQ